MSSWFLNLVMLASSISRSPPFFALLESRSHFSACLDTSLICVPDQSVSHTCKQAHDGYVGALGSCLPARHDRYPLPHITGFHGASYLLGELLDLLLVLARHGGVCRGDVPRVS